MVKKNLDDYLRLPYKIEVFPDDDQDHPGWVASIPELPGCITQADTFEELGEMIEDAKRAWLETALERGIPIPEPRVQEGYSGKFVVRVPRSLHRRLVEAADADGVSLNQYINVVLAEAVSAGLRENDVMEIEAPILRYILGERLSNPEVRLHQVEEDLQRDWNAAIHEYLLAEKIKSLRSLNRGREAEAFLAGQTYEVREGVEKYLTK